MRDEKEERKKQARSNKQTRQSNTAHPRQSLFLEKMSCIYMYIHVHVHACQRDSRRLSKAGLVRVGVVAIGLLSRAREAQCSATLILTACMTHIQHWDEISHSIFIFHHWTGNKI